MKCSGNLEARIINPHSTAELLNFFDPDQDPPTATFEDDFSHVIPSPIWARYFRHLGCSLTSYHQLCNILHPHKPHPPRSSSSNTQITTKLLFSILSVAHRIPAQPIISRKLRRCKHATCAFHVSPRTAIRRFHPSTTDVSDLGL